MNRDMQIILGWVAIVIGLVALNDAYKDGRTPLVARVFLPL